MDEYLDNFLVLDKFNVSRETLSVLDEFRELIIVKKNGAAFIKTSDKMNVYPFHIPKVPNQHLQRLKYWFI